MNLEVLSTRSLNLLKEIDKTEAEMEHVTPLIKSNDRFIKQMYTPQLNKELSKIRVTVDTYKDYFMLNLAYLLGGKKRGLNLTLFILKYFKFLFIINKNISQRK